MTPRSCCTLGTSRGVSFSLDLSCRIVPIRHFAGGVRLLLDLGYISYDAGSGAVFCQRAFNLITIGVA